MVERQLQKVAMLAASVLDKLPLADVLTRILEIEVELDSGLLSRFDFEFPRVETKFAIVLC